MRRSVQTVVLYEANRCLKERYSLLRPFQRKVALYDTSRDIIETLDFIPIYQRMQIMFRTSKAKVPLTPELTWRKMKVIDRELTRKVIPKVKPFLEETKTHEEICNSFIQSEYEDHATTVKGTQSPANWEHTHICIFLVYRMYYLGENVNPNVPKAHDPNPNRVVPMMKPPLDSYPEERVEFRKSLPEFRSSSHKRHLEPNNTVENKKLARPQMPLSPSGKRKLVLKEVRKHLELLKEFEGVISMKMLHHRKKELFSALPPVPSPGKVNISVPKSDEPTIFRSAISCSTK